MNTLLYIFLSPLTTSTTVQVLIFAAILFMMMDVLFGSINAAMHKEFSSGKMREGIGHKCSELGFILVGIIIDAILSVGVELPLGIEGPILSIICVGLILMEFGSLLEIWAKMNPQLAKIKIFQILASVKVLEETSQQDNTEE